MDSCGIARRMQHDCGGLQLTGPGQLRNTMLTVAVDHARERRQAVVEEHVLLVGAGHERVRGQRRRRGLRRRRQLVLPERLQAVATQLLDAGESRHQLAQARDHPRDCADRAAEMACC